ncbi:hypothetical protein [Lacimicrobium sp. SS2-24]|uniref:hypothetical protein n=1 Tax=Lacimicrobium sp. SS2-24 TaxID=2005569 RepID=UPI000B4B3C8E|nr:hypothetical protein [Lacimicrobium sp. SS2-24]
MSKKTLLMLLMVSLCLWAMLAAAPYYLAWRALSTPLYVIDSDQHPSDTMKIEGIRRSLSIDSRDALFHQVKQSEIEILTQIPTLIMQLKAMLEQGELRPVFFRTDGARVNANKLLRLAIEETFSQEQRLHAFNMVVIILDYSALPTDVDEQRYLEKFAHNLVYIKYNFAGVALFAEQVENRPLDDLREMIESILLTERAFYY